MQLREIHPQIVEAGAALVSVAGRSVAVAKSLAPTMPFSLWLDPDQTVRTALEIDRLSVAEVVSVKSAMNYGKALAQIPKMRVFPEAANLKPAVFVLDAEQNVTWKHLGQALGDYPAPSEVLTHL